MCLHISLVESEKMYAQPVETPESSPGMTATTVLEGILICGFASGQIEFRKLPELEVLGEIERPRTGSGGVVSLGGLGRTLVAGYHSGHLALFDVQSRELLRIIRDAHMAPILCLLTFEESDSELAPKAKAKALIVLSADQHGHVVRSTFWPKDGKTCEKGVQVQVVPFREPDASMGIVLSCGIFEKYIFLNGTRCLQLCTLEKPLAFFPSPRQGDQLIPAAACFLAAELPPDFPAARYFVFSQGAQLRLHELGQDDQVLWNPPMTHTFGGDTPQNVLDLKAIRALIFGVILDPQKVLILQWSGSLFFVLYAVDDLPLISHSNTRFYRDGPSNAQLGAYSAYHNGWTPAPWGNPKSPKQRLTYALYVGTQLLEIRKWGSLFQQMLTDGGWTLLMQTQLEIHALKRPPLLDYFDSDRARHAVIERQVTRLVDTYVSPDTPSSLIHAFTACVSLRLWQTVFTSLYQHAKKHDSSAAYFQEFQKCLVETPRFPPKVVEFGVYTDFLNWLDEDSRIVLEARLSRDQGIHPSPDRALTIFTRLLTTEHEDLCLHLVETFELKLDGLAWEIHQEKPQLMVRLFLETRNYGGALDFLANLSVESQPVRATEFLNQLLKHEEGPPFFGENLPAFEKLLPCDLLCQALAPHYQANPTLDLQQLQVSTRLVFASEYLGNQEDSGLAQMYMLDLCHTGRLDELTAFVCATNHLQFYEVTPEFLGQLEEYPEFRSFFRGLLGQFGEAVHEFLAYFRESSEPRIIRLLRQCCLCQTYNFPDTLNQVILDCFIWSLKVSESLAQLVFDQLVLEFVSSELVLLLNDQQVDSNQMSKVWLMCLNKYMSKLRIRQGAAEVCRRDGTTQRERLTLLTKRGKEFSF